MLTVRVSGDFQAAIARLTKEPERIRRATVGALNKTAEQARAEVRSAMPRRLDRPTPYALNAVRAVKARGGKLESEVTLHGLPGGRGVSGHKFLGPQIAGGARRDKASERRLKRAGVMPMGYQMVPGDGVRLDAYGNVPIRTVLQVLSWLQTYRSHGDRGRNTSAATMERRRKGTRRKYGYEYFVMPPGSTWASGNKAQPGIYKRTFIGTGRRGGAVTAVDPIFIFVRTVNYRPRLEFADIVKTVARRDFGGNLQDALRAPQ